MVKEMWTKGKELQIQSSSLIQYRSLPRTWKPNFGPLELFNLFLQNAPYSSCRV